MFMHNILYVNASYIFIFVLISKHKYSNKSYDGTHEAILQIKQLGQPYFQIHVQPKISIILYQIGFYRSHVK